MEDFTFVRRALRLAARGYGQTSPNPMVGAVLVKRGKIIGQVRPQEALKFIRITRGIAS